MKKQKIECLRHGFSILWVLLTFRIVCSPIFRFFFSLVYFSSWYNFLGGGFDPTAPHLFFISDGSSADSNSASIVPANNFPQEEPIEAEAPGPPSSFYPFYQPINPFDPVDLFRLQNLDTELELFARIRLLESRLIEAGEATN